MRFRLQGYLHFPKTRLEFLHQFQQDGQSVFMQHLTNLINNLPLAELERQPTVG